MIGRGDGASRWLLVGLLSTGCYSGHEGGEAADDDGAEDGDGDGADDGVDGDDDDDDDDDNGVGAQCDGEQPPRAALRRMSKTTYVNALTDVFGPEVVDQVQLSIDAMPATHGGVFSTETLSPTYAEVTAAFDVATKLAFALTQDDTALANLDPCLTAVPDSADPSSDDCLGGVLDEYGRRLLRRPLTDADRSRLSEDYAIGGEHSVAEGVSTMLTALLIDPEFLYYGSQLAGEEVADGIVELTDHELAARLARVVWRSIPDAELLDVADAGLSDDALAEQIDRMLDDPRAREAIASFYADWLDLEALPFPSETLYPDPEVAADLRDAMEAEILALSEHVTLDADGTYADLLLDRTTTLDSAELAAVYGAQVGDTTLPDDRAGLLTRAGFLATNEIRGTNAGHLIKRGNRLSRIVCRDLPLPDPDNFPQEDPADPENNPDQGIRERFAEATAEPMCSSCHIQLDSFGAPFGHYGSAGQWIDTETIELAEGGTNDLEIDTTAEITLDGDPIPVSDGIVLSEQIAASQVGAQCFAQQLTRDILARPLEPADACMVEVAGDVLAPEDSEPGTIREALVTLLGSEHFRRVAIQ